MDLSNRAVKNTCHNWGLAQFHGRTHDAPGAIGRGVRWGNTGQTTAIVAIDVNTRRVLTQTGSVYELGVPNIGFAMTHRDIMVELGF